MKRLATIFFSLLSWSVYAQVTLAPAINTGQMPAPGDTIGAFTPYIDTTMQFMLSGYHVGDLVPDFTLHDENGVSYNLQTELQAGKPVLLIGISYSCPQARNGMVFRLPPVLNQYGQQIKVFVIYTLEAHPVAPDVSPYSGNVWVTPNNYLYGILYPQHKFYSDRVGMSHLADSLLGINAPVLIDGPGNEWLQNYGPAPHNAYLIAPNGHVYRKYGWFDNDNYDISYDIGMLLMLTSSPEQSAVPAVAAVHPNPAPSGAQLNVEGLDEYSLTVFDVSGRCILSEKQTSVSSYPIGQKITVPGLYTYVITSPGGTILRGRFSRF